MPRHAMLIAPRIHTHTHTYRTHIEWYTVLVAELIYRLIDRFPFNLVNVAQKNRIYAFTEQWRIALVSIVEYIFTFYRMEEMSAA